MPRPSPIKRPYGRFFLDTLTIYLLFARVYRPISDFNGFSLFLLVFLMFFHCLVITLICFMFLLISDVCFYHSFSLKMGRDVVEQHY